MTPQDLKVLAERASTVEGRSGTRLDEVRSRIQASRRRRQYGAVGATVVAVVLALTTGVGLLALTDPDRTPPAEPAPRPTATPGVPEDKAPSVRRLTYATGDTIHHGDRVIDVGGKVEDVTAPDDGVVFIRGGTELTRACRNYPVTGGCDALWFTDGSDVVRIGTVFGTVIRGFRIEYVVYDTGERREVARFGSANSHIQGVYDDYVYWIPDDATWCPDFAKYYGVCRRYQGMMRLEASTGIQTEVSLAAYRADRRSRPRAFTRPIRGEANAPGPVYDESIGFLREGNRLVVDDGGGHAMSVRVARTGEPVWLRLPAGFRDVDWFPMFMWLDDDRVAVTADEKDILVCRLSTGRCRVAVTGAPLTGFGGRG